MSDELNCREELFCREYVIDLNPARAAIVAGYSEKGAAQCASRLLTRVKIKMRVAELTSKTNEKLEISAEWVLSELRKLAGYDAVNLFDENGNLTPMSDWPMSSRAAVVGLEFEERFERDGNNERVHVGTARKIKLADKIRALELLGRYLKLFKDQLEIPGVEKLADELEKARRRVEAIEDGAQPTASA